MAESAKFLIQYCILNSMKKKFDYFDILWMSRITELQRFSEIKFYNKS